MGEIIDHDNKRIDGLNNKIDNMTTKGQRNVRRMENYL